jgi:hypothetical protein
VALGAFALRCAGVRGAASVVVVQGWASPHGGTDYGDSSDLKSSDESLASIVIRLSAAAGALGLFAGTDDTVAFTENQAGMRWIVHADGQTLRG